MHLHDNFYIYEIKSHIEVMRDIEKKLPYLDDPDMEEFKIFYSDFVLSLLSRKSVASFKSA